VAFEAPHRRRPLRVASAEDVAPGSARPPPVAIPIDSYADAALARERDATERALGRCDACDREIEGEPAGLGLFLTTRGDEVRFEEPPLCSWCATAIGLSAGEDAEIEEEEG
jgi:hypothetical protein